MIALLTNVFVSRHRSKLLKENNSRQWLFASFPKRQTAPQTQRSPRTANANFVVSCLIIHCLKVQGFLPIFGQNERMPGGLIHGKPLRIFEEALRLHFNATVLPVS